MEPRSLDLNQFYVELDGNTIAVFEPSLLLAPPPIHPTVVLGYSGV